MPPDLIRRLRILKNILFNENGQLSIFIALIFQVLFVFFAMIINIGLMVHDKINLQNAADFAAYYGAERQAEILNEIAHVNYQIRQDYKLLTWRFRVMGTLGRNGGSPPPPNATVPARRQDPTSLQEAAWVNPTYDPKELPSVCVTNEAWYEVIKNSNLFENYCYKDYGTAVPQIPSLPVIAPFVPGLTESAAFTKQAQDFQIATCYNSGPLNWAFTMQMIYDYKLAIAARKELIKALRQNLLAADMLDLSNQSTKTGVTATLTKNLTESNRNGTPQIDMINGLADPNCNPGDGGEFIMPEILIAPQLLYTTFNCTTKFFAASQAVQSDYKGLDPAQMKVWDPNGLMRNMAGEPELTQPTHSSLGFEKNPWCMAYVGVKVTTQSRKPFSPFGTATQLQARAFAQPFGGRIGPWYRSRWPRSAPTSSGGNRVDPLTVPRVLGAAFDTTQNDAEKLPNFSRFPGDTLGLTSQLALGAQNQVIMSYASAANKQGRLHLTFYSNFDTVPTTGDTLVSQAAPSTGLRSAEVAAVTPDLFDAIYYSVDPNYYQAYVQSSPVDRGQGLVPILGQAVKQLPDAGGSLANNGGAVATFNVESQIEQSVASGLDQRIISKLFWVIRSWTHLLTGWVSHGVQAFDFPTDRFAVCDTPAVADLPIPGKCWMGGGRIGYSVRLISRSALTFGGWNIGGDGESPGAILNPPSADF